MKYSRILIVEDEVLIQNYLKDIISKLGGEVAAIVDNGEDAVRLTSELDIDLVLMDIKLAGKMSGLEAAKQILTRSQVKIVFISAYDFAEEIKKLNRFIEFLHKPVDTNDLKRILEG